MSNKHRREALSEKDRAFLIKKVMNNQSQYKEELNNNSKFYQYLQQYVPDDYMYKIRNSHIFDGDENIFSMLNYIERNKKRQTEPEVPTNISETMFPYLLQQPEPQTPREQLYTVKQGDTISKIASNNNVSIQNLLDHNTIQNPNLIFPGQQLNIPVREEPLDLKESEESKLGDYKVKEGDTLSKIAKENKMSLSSLLRINPNIKNPNTIFVGQHINLADNKNTVVKSKQWVDIEDLRKQEAEYNKTNLGAIQGATHDSNYVVIDKKNKKLSVYDAGNNLIWETRDISTGASGQDYNTKTYTRSSNGRTLDSGKGNMSTPAGITRISSIDNYHGVPSIQRARIDSKGNIQRVIDSRTGKEIDDNIASSMHLGSVSSTYSSNGCVRMSAKALRELEKHVSVGTLIYTLPSNENSRFILRDGNLNYEADNPYGITEKGVRYNKYGKDMWDHDDYNVFNNKTSTPIRISFNKNNNDISTFKGIKKEIKDYLGEDNRNVVMQTLSDYKETLQKEFNISDYHYNNIAKLALGVIDTETGFGGSTKYIHKNAVLSIPRVGDDVYYYAKKMMNDNTEISRGLGQIKMKADNEEMQRYYQKYGINTDNIADPDKSAIAVALRLLYTYKNEVQGKNFEIDSQFLKKANKPEENPGIYGKNKEGNIVLNPYVALLYLYKGGSARKALKNKEALGDNEKVSLSLDAAKKFKIETYR